MFLPEHHQEEEKRSHRMRESISNKDLSVDYIIIPHNSVIRKKQSNFQSRYFTKDTQMSYQDIKKCSILLAFRHMKIKTTVHGNTQLPE